MHISRGNYIGGQFVPAKGPLFKSSDPATNQPVLEKVASDLSAVDAAVSAAQGAARGWRRLGLTGRIEALRRVQAALPDHKEGIAQAICAEMGKPINEARIEAGSIHNKIEGVIRQLPHELPPAAPGAPGEQRFHALGVMAIVGPFNFPVHLCNTHIIPALLTGNAVVVKPSEVTPLAGQRYAELFEAAKFPAGVFNLVQGLGDVGAKLVAHEGVNGVVFTGSYATGRRIRKATFDQPSKKISLELGGKNPAVVLDDADLDQTVREILLGVLFTSGQRCTATSRVIATPGIAPALRARLVDALQKVKPGDPTSPDTLLGPMATHAARDRYMALLAEAREQGAEVLVESKALPGGAWVTPSIYAVQGHEAVLQEELFGPHLAFEIAADRADAFKRAANTRYGLSASLFSKHPEALEAFYDVVPAGVINFNRSTNGASGLLPFGGTGMSGNWRSAGSAAPRLSTYPVAVMQLPFGSITPNAALEALLEETS